MENEKIKESVLLVKLNYFHAKDCCLQLYPFYILGVNKIRDGGFSKSLKIKKKILKNVNHQHSICYVVSDH